MRQIKYTNAKGVHIFKNANSNNKGYTIVSFQSRRDLLEARKYNLKYYYTNLIWESEKNENQDRKHYNKSQVSDDSVKIYKSNLRENHVKSNYEAFCDTNIREENSYQSAFTKKKYIIVIRATSIQKMNNKSQYGTSPDK